MIKQRNLMSRIYTSKNDKETHKINKQSVANFFEERAKKIPVLGPMQAVIYQDKNPELAIQRDKIEKTKLLPLLKLDGTQRVLDVGCGTGRWAKEILPVCRYYHGIDVCENLAQYAKRSFSHSKHARFSTASIDNYSLKTLKEEQGFDRILCMGVTIYLNDDELQKAIKNLSESLITEGMILVRDPVGLGSRLTLKNIFSEEMNQHYSAIYRTEEELIEAFTKHGKSSNLKLIRSGDMYKEQQLNNRKDTKQKFFIFSSSEE